MPGGSADTGLLQWGVGILVAFISMSLGWLWTKVSTLEVKVDANAESARTRMQSGDDRLWEAIKASNDHSDAFRTKMLETMRDVPTKGDMAAMEGRLSADIHRQQPSRT